MSIRFEPIGSLVLARWVGPLLCVMAASFANAEPAILTLAEAEQRAVDADPGTRALLARSEALSEAAVAAGQLPDPKLRFGALAVPVDSFDFDQEPMSQLQLGYQQRFLPGRTLDLRRAQLSRQSEVEVALARDRALQTRRAVQLDYVDIVSQRRVAAVLDEAHGLFSELRAATEDYYASGRTNQQDVLRSELELSRIEERLARVRQAEDEARTRLSEWVGEAAWRPIDERWPALQRPEWPASWPASQSNHPRLTAQAGRLAVSEAGVDVAREQYKPGWMIDVSYGDRSGQNLDGSARADFLSAMVTVDLPLFRANRQDRGAAAAARQADAERASLEEMARSMQRAAERERVVLSRLDERLELFEQRLLPDAAANSAAALDAYRSGVVDFTALMRARITEVELRIDHLRAEADRLRAIARLQYQMGGSS